ncbi:hypothetical protein [Paenibacillus turpanensis]|uniref:hypothetical protein n=1 Tax=Paenibacillus turpanensis TaxID=2689078 RepID=UPI00140BC198|nr:hypothetical protein [Paenibacillus turpanensis]
MAAIKNKKSRKVRGKKRRVLTKKKRQHAVRGSVRRKKGFDSAAYNTAYNDAFNIAYDRGFDSGFAKGLAEAGALEQQLVSV